MLLPDFLLSARRPLAVGFLWSHRGNWRSVPVPQSDPAAWSRTAVRLSQEPKTLTLHHTLWHKHTPTHKRWSLAVSGNIRHPQALTAEVTETELPCISPFPTPIGLLDFLFALSTNSKYSDSNHRKPFIQVGPRMAVPNEWRQLSDTAVLRSQHQREGWVIPVRTHGEEKLSVDTTPWTWVDSSFVSGFKCSTLLTLGTQNSFYSCIEDKERSQAGQAWKTLNCCWHFNGHHSLF